MEVPRASVYYRKQHEKKKPYSEEEAQAVDRMFRKHHGSFGRRVLHEALKKESIHISEHRISRIMKDRDLHSKYGRKRCTNVHTNKESAERYIAENKYWNIEEKARPRKVWSMDFTEQKVESKTIYTCGIISVEGKTLVSRITGERNSADTACKAVKKGIERYGAPEMILTDRGSPFTSKSFHELLEKEKITHSMSRPHTPRDNRYIETYWHTMKTEIGPVGRLTVEEYMMIMEYYEHYYNYERPHSALNYVPPLVAKRDNGWDVKPRRLRLLSFTSQPLRKCH